MKGRPFKTQHSVEENTPLLLLMQLLHIVLVGIIYIVIMFGYYVIGWFIFGFV